MDAAAARGGAKARRRTKKDKQAEEAAAEAAAAPRMAEQMATVDAAAEAQPSLSRRMAQIVKQQLSSMVAGTKAEEEGEVAHYGAADQPGEDPVHCDGGGLCNALFTDEAPFVPDKGLAARTLLAVQHASWQAAAPAAMVLLLGLGLLLVGTALAHRRAGRQLSQLEVNLTERLRQLADADVALQHQVAQLQQEQQRLQEHTDIAAATLARVQQAQAAWDAAPNPADVAAELQQLRRELAHLQARPAPASAPAPVKPTEPPASDAAAARDGTPGDEPPPVPGQAALGEARVMELARKEAAAALDLFAADRTGQPDWALAAAGAKVLAHSPVLPPSPTSRLLPATLANVLIPAGSIARQQAGSASLHPRANSLLLSPVTGPGDCLPLAGNGTGHVDICLAQAVRPTGVTYEHIPASIAYDSRSTPRDMVLLGYRGPPPTIRPTAADAAVYSGMGIPSGDTLGSAVPRIAAPSEPAGGGPLLLGRFAYDAGGRGAVQTFPLQAPPSATVDHVRLLVLSNHGRHDYTCLYRLRLHGTPA